MASSLKQIYLLTFLLTFAWRIQCQEKEGQKNMTDWYDSLMGKDHIGLIEGKYYPIQYSKGESHQFYLDKSWTLGQVSIKGQIYDSIMLMYEVVNDVLLLKHPVNFKYHAQPIALPRSKVQTFQLHGNQFVNIQQSPQGLKNGYYQLLLDGTKIQLLVKRSKFIRTEVHLEYTSLDWAYIVTESTHHRIKNRWSLYQHWPEKKAELRKFIRQNSLKTNLKNESQMIKVVTFLDETLTTSTLAK
jgi:hypothetical protein